MTISFLFWLLMLLWLLFGAWNYWPRPGGPAPSPAVYWPAGSNLMLFVLLFLLGWRVFGFPIQ